MQLLRSFRLSIYVTLGIACLCLDYAEGGLLPETPYITGIVIFLLIIGYRIEGRWSLSLHAANMVGAALTLLLVGWIAYQFVPQRSAVLAQIEFPTKLLPYLGPVLMILIPVKLFRPKHIGDFWAMQGIGMLAVALGCAMANDLLFGLLLITYLCSFVWSMSLFFLYREVRPEKFERPASLGNSRGFLLFGQAGRWSAVIVGAGLVLFLILPRPNDKKWELPLRVKGKVETGAPEGSLDLNHTGAVEPNRDVAFDVRAQDVNKQAILNLNPNQRWKLRSLSRYENGKWSSEQSSIFSPAPNLTSNNFKPSNTLNDLPDLGSQRFYLSFSIHANSGAQNVLADPILWRAGDRPPVVTINSHSPMVQQKSDGNFEWISSTTYGRASYCQACAPTLVADQDLGPPMYFSKKNLKADREYSSQLIQMPSKVLSTMKKCTWPIVEQLIKEDKLSKEILDERDPLTRIVPPRHHEAIARCLRDYLAQSGEFTYSLQLEKKDPKVDPVEDFLLNTKSGHCQRFASALALMLRSLGIPCQLVLGYKGCESSGDGWYKVRQLNAHAWVEVLIRRSPATRILPAVAGEKTEPMSYHWLSLDPTPGSDGAGDEARSDDWLATGEGFFNSFILFYDTEQRKNALMSLLKGLEDFGSSIERGEMSWPGAGAVVALLLIPVGWAARRAWRRQTAPHERCGSNLRWVIPFHGRLLRCISRYGWRALAGETALEFAARVSRELREVWNCPPEQKLRKGENQLNASPRIDSFEELADVPLRVARAYYRVRFGGGEMSVSECRDLDDSIERLARALAKVSRDRLTASMNGGRPT